MRRLTESIGYAAEGVQHAAATQRHVRIQVGLLAGSVLLAAVCQLPTWCWVVMGAVWLQVIMVELLNTALEELSEGLWGLLYHPRAKLVKDLAAGAVLLAAVLAAIVTVALFWLHRAQCLAARPLVGWGLFGAVIGYAVYVRVRSARWAQAIGVTAIVATLQRWMRG